MRPTLLITSGDEHEIFAGDNVPVPVAAREEPRGSERPPERGRPEPEPRGPGRARPSRPRSARERGAGRGVRDRRTGTGTTGTGTDWSNCVVFAVSQNIERKDVGTTLRVTPTVGAQGGVTLELRVEVSSLTESLAGPVEEVGPTIRDVTIESTIRLQGGEIAVIATAALPELQRKTTGIPWLMDIPVLGWAFRTTDEQTLNRHLLVAARAEILRPESRDLVDRLARELAPASAALALTGTL